VLAAGLVSFGTFAYAQYGPPNGPYQPDSVCHMVDKVHADLDQGYHHWHLNKGDRDRLNGAEKKLRGFAADWRHGKFDKGDLDESIASIQHVLDNNQFGRTRARPTGQRRGTTPPDAAGLRPARDRPLVISPAGGQVMAGCALQWYAGPNCWVFVHERSP
jgi:hypothetical protein